MIHKLQESLEHLKILTVNNINKNLASSGLESWKKYYLQNKKNLGPNHSFSIYLFFQIFMVECCLAMFSEFKGTLMQI